MLVQNKNIQQDYILDEKMGQGNYAVVHRAFSRSLKKQFAVKIIDKRSMDLDQQINLETQVMIMSQINHPNVVKLIQVYDNEKACYLVMELMTGGELFDRIVEREYYSEKDACQVMLPLIDAVRFCHDLGIAHRDIKPQNLLYSSMDESAIIKISDFGISKVINNDLTWTAIGTPSYLAPEVINGKGYGIQIDYWALGIILYILLCGYPPFCEDNNQKLFNLIKAGDFQFPEQQWGRISNQAKDLIKNLIQVDPCKRFKAQQIFDHPWIKEKKKTLHLNEVPQKIKNYIARRRLRMASLTVFASKVLSKHLNYKKQ